jgi:uncharacterized PurR-regulated membrane protein YhhQ (DUF165 family)
MIGLLGVVMITHEIVGVIEGGGPEDLSIRVRIIASRATFVKKPKELYDKRFLTLFSNEDVAYIGFLNASVYGDGLIPIHYFPRKKQRLTNSVVFIAILFVCFSIMSNMTAFRVASINLAWLPIIGNPDVRFPAGLVLFPATYAFSTILTEVYGYSISRLVIWGGLGANALLIFGIWITAFIPTSSEWALHTDFNETAYKIIILAYIKTFAASLFAYLFSEFINAAVLAKLKIATMGKYKAIRIITSTGLAVSIDSIIFCLILFLGTLSIVHVIFLIFIQMAVKLLYEFAFLPIIILVSRYLKYKDGVDYYDFDTKFNPFSFKT